MLITYQLYLKRPFVGNFGQLGLPHALSDLRQEKFYPNGATNAPGGIERAKEKRSRPTAYFVHVDSLKRRC
jgi:hypothetical protein